VFGLRFHRTPAGTAKIPQLKEQQTNQVLSADRLARVESYQHPDHDTDAWPAQD